MKFIELYMKEEEKEGWEWKTDSINCCIEESKEKVFAISCDVSNSKEKLDPIYSNNLMRMGSNYD